MPILAVFYVFIILYTLKRSNRLYGQNTAFRLVVSNYESILHKRTGKVCYIFVNVRCFLPYLNTWALIHIFRYNKKRERVFPCMKLSNILYNRKTVYLQFFYRFHVQFFNYYFAHFPKILLLILAVYRLFLRTMENIMRNL